MTVGVQIVIERWPQEKWVMALTLKRRAEVDGLPVNVGAGVGSQLCHPIHPVATTRQL